MIAAGIDVGARATKVVLLGGGKFLSRGRAVTGFDQNGAARQALDEASKVAGITSSSVEKVVATGVGKRAITFAFNHVTEVAADAKGAHHLYPNVRTVIDVGSEEARVIKCDPTGMVVDFAMNEKCAAGVGAFVETMARALDLTTEEMGSLSLQSQKTIPLNSQCVVFAESEVVTLMHAKTDREDIARAVHDAIASRIGCLVRSVGVEEQVVLVGGLARNAGLIDSLKRNMSVNITVPEDPEYVGALGAAMIAIEGS